MNHASQRPAPSLADLGRGFLDRQYLADRGLLTAARLSIELQIPLLLEGEPGVGKTELAAVLAATLGRELVRLQCYEGLDAAHALYEWNYPKQLLHVRGAEPDVQPGDGIYTDGFLLERPLLRSLRSPTGAVLLIDEIDRADDQFEAFLLEFLGEFQVTIPEIGTIGAATPPIVVLTSNRTRELHDAMKRRCLYHWIEFPPPEREREILALRVPGLPERAAEQIVAAIGQVRSMSLVKRPGVAESIEWARGASVLVDDGDEWPTALIRALGLLVKDRHDVERVDAHLQPMLSGTNE